METWLAGVKRLSGFARAFAQKLYAILSMMLYQKFQFVQHVTLKGRPLFEPLEVELREEFLPLLLGGTK